MGNDQTGVYLSVQSRVEKRRMGETEPYEVTYDQGWANAAGEPVNDAALIEALNELYPEAVAEAGMRGVTDANDDSG